MVCESRFLSLGLMGMKPASFRWPASPPSNLASSLRPHLLAHIPSSGVKPFFSPPLSNRRSRASLCLFRIAFSSFRFLLPSLTWTSWSSSALPPAPPGCLLGPQRAPSQATSWSLSTQGFAFCLLPGLVHSSHLSDFRSHFRRIHLFFMLKQLQSHIYLHGYWVAVVSPLRWHTQTHAWHVVVMQLFVDEQKFEWTNAWMMNQWVDSECDNFGLNVQIPHKGSKWTLWRKGVCILDSLPLYFLLWSLKTPCPFSFPKLPLGHF